MPASKQWKQLDREVETLRRQFLPDQFDPLGQYRRPILVQAHTRAFVVLCHAEIEGYLEGCAKDIGQAAERIWNSSKRISEPFAFLLATHSDRLSIPNTLTGGKVKDSPQLFTEVAVKLFQKYYKRINENHGIKEKNVLALFAPLGVSSAAFGATLLPNLDTLGALRGVYAHQSSKSVQAVLDPETEYNRVVAVVTELLSFDQWFRECRQRIR